MTMQNNSQCYNALAVTPRSGRRRHSRNWLVIQAQERRYLRITVSLIVLILSAIAAEAATTWYSDGSATGNNTCSSNPSSPNGSVQWINDNCAQDGDTIQLPSRDFIWSTGVLITKGITLRGNTTVT